MANDDSRVIVPMSFDNIRRPGRYLLAIPDLRARDVASRNSDPKSAGGRSFSCLYVPRAYERLRARRFQTDRT
jgi:hypothetical protein